MINAPTHIPTPIYGNLIKPENLTEIFPALNIVADNILSIFQSLSLQVLGKCCLVSKEWNRLANDPWISKMFVFQHFAFNPTHWNTYCGKTCIAEEEITKAYKALPNNIFEILKSQCPAFPNKIIMDSHILVWIPENINGELLTLKSIGQLLKQKPEFLQTEGGYGMLHPSIKKSIGNTPIESGFVLMTREFLPDSLEFPYRKKLLLCNKPGLKAPKIGEAIVCIAAEYFRSGKRLFSYYNPPKYTLCEESIYSEGVVVGGFASEGLKVYLDILPSESLIGVAGLLRL